MTPPRKEVPAHDRGKLGRDLQEIARRHRETMPDALQRAYTLRGLTPDRHSERRP